MELKYKNNKQELYDFYRYFLECQTSIKKYKFLKKVIMIPIGLLLSLSSLYFRWGLIQVHGYLTNQDVAFIFIPITVGVLWWLIGTILANTIKKEKFEDIIKKIKYKFDDEINIKLIEAGVVLKKADEEIEYKWDSIKKVTEENQCIYIVLRNNRGIVIPISAFNNNSSKENFIKNIKENI